jgi:hypothetical protein
VSSVPTLYHFTCDDHGYPGIVRTSTLQPRQHPLMPTLGPLLWLTDLAEPPTLESVGLTSQNLKCDRLAKRITVQSREPVHWSALREKAPKEVVGWLESLGQPDHWWVARRPLIRSEFTRP